MAKATFEVKKKCELCDFLWKDVFRTGLGVFMDGIDGATRVAQTSGCRKRMISTHPKR